MKKVLITGGAGFIGGHLTKLLIEKDFHVTLADNFSRGVADEELKALEKNKSVEIKNCDVLSETDVVSLGKDYNYIFHLAAIIGVQHVLKRPFDVLNLNNKMLSNLIALAHEQKSLNRFVFASTSEIYAGTLVKYGLEFPTKETSPLALTDLEQPRTSYMLSKIYGEAMCFHSGLPVTIVRPHNFFGPRMGLSHVVPELLLKCHKAKDGESLPVFSMNHQRTFCYIKDAVNYLLELAVSEKSINQAFNVGVEEPEHTIKQLAELMIKVTGKKMTIAPQEETPGSPLRRCPSMAKTHAAVAYRSKYTTEQAIRETYDWYKTNVFSGGVSAI